MKAVILLNGEPPELELLQAHLEESVLICTDGAADFAFKAGIYPKYLIGDMDSISMETFTMFEQAGVSILTSPVEKDETDAQIAVDMAIEKGFDELVLLGAFGKRLDHTLGNLQLLEYTAKRGVKAVAEDERQLVYAATGVFGASGKKDDIISVIPIANPIVSTKKLKYPLFRHKMETDIPLGISNVFLEPDIELNIENGYVFIIIQK